MRKLLVSIGAAASVLFASAVPASAITYGEPDAGEHPYVGFAIFFVPSDPGWFSCSGTLLDEDTFLTAGHCVFDVGTDGAETPGEATSGGNDVWVTFDETETLAGWPLRADIPDEAELYAARSAWLNDPAHGFTKGTAIHHPDYDDFASFPVNNDVGVIELDEAVAMSTYGVLAEFGLVDQLGGSTGKGRNTATVETVGYGIQSVHPKPMDVESRYKSNSRIVSVNANQSVGGNLHTSNNPSASGGRGGSCFGDSGGPVFQLDTNVVLAVVSYGPSNTCHGADYSWRVDTHAAQDFISPYLD
ncbi:MAG TPA: trypsin-like serine protease, partial [Ilumatobacteraceae bacterium]|nr:trypsin-like serine protease [Ilumatobacteraceae bacterium]